MSLHTSLKTSGNLASARNVLTRTERLAKLEKTKGYDVKQKSALGLPKTKAR